MNPLKVIGEAIRQLEYFPIPKFNEPAGVQNAAPPFVIADVVGSERVMVVPATFVTMVPLAKPGPPTSCPAAIEVPDATTKEVELDDAVPFVATVNCGGAVMK